MGRYKFEETLRLEGQLLKVLSHSRATYDLNSSIHILLILICASSLVTPPSFLKKTSSSTLLIVTRMLARSIITSILFASSGFGQMSMSSGAVDPSMTMASTVDPSMTMDSVTGSMMSSATTTAFTTYTKTYWHCVEAYNMRIRRWALTDSRKHGIEQLHKNTQICH